MSQPITARRPRTLLAYGVPLLALLWAFWPPLAEAAARWNVDPSYSHGWLVPLFAALMLWLRRDRIPADLLQPSWLLGSGLLAAGIGLRLYGTYFHYVWLDPIALLPCLAGVTLLIGGWGALRWAWPAILFLGFMIPLPFRAEGMLAAPLQRFATIVSTFLLQALGLPALAEGNVIMLSEVEMGIVEACSGLRMLVVFFALSTAFAILVDRPLWEKAIILGSAIPIALACNVIRITSTGILHEAVSTGGWLDGVVSRELPGKLYHDFAGWLMMPMGLAMLWVELRLLQVLWSEPAPAAAELPRLTSTDHATAASVQGPIAVASATRTRKPWKPARSSRAFGVESNPAGLP